MRILDTRLLDKLCLWSLLWLKQTIFIPSYQDTGQFSAINSISTFSELKELHLYLSEPGNLHIYFSGRTCRYSPVPFSKVDTTVAFLSMQRSISTCLTTVKITLYLCEHAEHDMCFSEHAEPNSFLLNKQSITSTFLDMQSFTASFSSETLKSRIVTSTFYSKYLKMQSMTSAFLDIHSLTYTILSRAHLYLSESAEPDLYLNKCTLRYHPEFKDKCTH